MLFQNARIVDGTGNPAYVGHVAVQDGRIVRIARDGTIPEGDFGDVVDCAGRILCPGFIDAHSHNDFFAAKPANLPWFEPFLRQGVTTMVVGNCGFSAAGYDESTIHNDEVGGGLFSNDGANFGSFSAWADRVDGRIPVNMVALVGHGTARIGVNGKGGAPLTPAQLAAMTATIDRSLSEGAAGVSFGLMYEPGQFAPAAELEAVARVVRAHDKVMTFHARACSKVSTSYDPPVGGRPHNLRAMDEVVDLLRKTGAKTQYSHLIFVGRRSWNTVEESLSILEQAKADGFDVAFDMYPMEFGASIITVVLPVWYLGMDPAKRRRPLVRLRLWLEVMVATAALGFGFGDILVTNTYGVLPEAEGLRVTEIAKRWRKTPFSTYLDLVDRTGGRIDVLMYQYQNDAIIERLRRHPLSLYMTDAWIVAGAGVQNFAAFHAFPKFLRLALDRGPSLEDAVRKMTGATAARFGLGDRGVIAEGAAADLVLFDPVRLGYREGRDAAPTGIELVMTNGRIVVKDGIVDAAAAETAGRLLRV